MSNTITLSRSIVVRLTTQNMLSTRVIMTQANNSSTSIIHIPNNSSSVVRVPSPSSQLAIKVVLGDKGLKGDTGPAPVVNLVGDQIEINGILGPHLAVNIPENIDAVANQILGGHRVVQVFNGIADYADNITAYDGQLGLTMGAVNQGDNFKVYTTGVVTEPTWDFVKGPIFLSTDGMLTQTKPDVGTVILVGRAISQHSMSIQFQQLYRRL
jgi:hypothetical protein